MSIATIPGRPPILPSSQTRPENNSPRTPELSEAGSLTPRAMIGLQFVTSPEVNGEWKGEDSQEVDAERRKSASRNLPPLVILSNDQSLLPSMAYRKSNLADNDAPPPQVPPKSPRTMSKAFTQSGRVLSSSVNSSTSTLHTASTSMTSVDSPEDVVYCMPWSAPIRTDSRDTYHRGFSGTDDMVSPPPRSAKELRASSSRHFRGTAASIDELPLAKPGTPIVRPPTSTRKSKSPKRPASPMGKIGTLTMKPSTPMTKPSTQIMNPASPEMKQVSPTAKSESPKTKHGLPSAKLESPKSRPVTPVMKSGSPINRPRPPISKFSVALRSEERPGPGTLGLQKVESETSVMNRGRPMRRGEASLRRKQPQVTEIETENDDGYDNLPGGVCSLKALSTIPTEELRSLRKRAKRSAETFKILRECEVSNLSKVRRLQETS